MIKFLSFMGIVLLMFGCGQEGEGSKEEILLHGEWRIVSSDLPIKTFQNGMKFAPNGQVFQIDSQGHIVPPHHKISFEVKGDTLSIVDHKYVPQILFEKGTSVYLIDKIDSSQLILTEIHPEKGNVLEYKNHH